MFFGGLPESIYLRAAFVRSLSTGLCYFSFLFKAADFTLCLLHWHTWEIGARNFADKISHLH
jgi:hypothetical protein